MLRLNRELLGLLEPKRAEISAGDRKLRAINRPIYRPKTDRRKIMEREERGGNGKKEVGLGACVRGGTNGLHSSLHMGKI